MRELIIILPWPLKYLWPNKRGWSWQAQNADKVTYYEEAFYYALDMRIKGNWQMPNKVRVSVKATRNGTGPAADVDNLLAALKPAFDAFTQARVWVDDNPAHWELGTVESLKGDKTEVRITVEALE